MALKTLLAVSALSAASAFAQVQTIPLVVPDLPIQNWAKMPFNPAQPFGFKSRDENVGVCLSRAALMSSLAVSDPSTHLGSPQVPMSGVCIDSKPFMDALKKHGPALKAAGLLTPDASVQQTLKFFDGLGVRNLGVAYQCEPHKVPKSAQLLAQAARLMLAEPSGVRVPVDATAASVVCTVTHGSMPGSLMPAASVPGVASPVQPLPVVPLVPRSSQPLMV
jgi:hypothetical protein